MSTTSSTSPVEFPLATIFGTGIFFGEKSFLGIPGKGNQTFHHFLRDRGGKQIPDLEKKRKRKENLSKTSFFISPSEEMRVGVVD